MKVAFALFFYAAAIILIYSGFAIPEAEGLNHHIAPVNTAELTAAMLIVMGCAFKLAGHLCLFASARS